ncbi:uncharacterized protein LOC135461453 [Liolophura sinensis]|uniref:uncharacterized protein LOC135461453 n=1 Tax=Liolophura sinensis TaxID=3198878 RepID=UPI0031580820
MEFSSNQFEILINLADERARDTGQSINDSPKTREFPEFGFPNADVLTHSLRRFTKLPSVPDVREEDAPQNRHENTVGNNVRVVNGSDIGDIPIEYRIEALADFELPVKGFYVDKRIIPGFQYTVRFNGTQTWLFNGEPRLLKSVGMGYGKRLTFAGESPTDSICFWSDSCEDGYAFAVHAVEEGDEFVICDERLRPLGRAHIESLLLPQREISTFTTGGDVTMRVKVVVSVVAEYNLERHGMLPLVSGETAVAEGVAIVMKKRKQRNAMTVRIEQVVLPKVGPCSLCKEL